jgi:hypothetical protein
MPMTPTRISYLEVNSIPLSLVSWWIINLDDVMNTGPTVVGADRPLHAGAVKNYPRYKTSTRKQFNMVIVGEYDRLAAAQTDPRAGVTLNAQYLINNLGLGSTSGDGTVTAVWHQWGGSAPTASVTVLGLTLGAIDERAHMKAVLDLQVASPGVFT